MIKPISSISFKSLYIDAKKKYSIPQLTALKNISDELFLKKGASTKLESLEAWNFDIFCTANKNGNDIDAYLTTGKPDYSNKGNPFDCRIYLGKYDEEKSQNFNNFLEKTRILYRDIVLSLTMTAILLAVFMMTCCNGGRQQSISEQLKSISKTIEKTK